ncbi:hypothetical protein X975_05269, partial [Stegodyphus mimosarum]
MGNMMKIILSVCLVILVAQQCRGDSSEDEDEPLGGVSIKVFRGPSKKVNGRQIFAPFGYYVKMPADTNKRKKSEDENDDDNGQFNDDNEEQFNDDDKE